MAKKVVVTKEVAEKFIEFTGSLEYNKIVSDLPSFNKKEKAKYALLDMLAVIGEFIAPVIIPGENDETEPSYDDNGEVVHENSEQQSENLTDQEQSEEIPGETQAKPDANEFDIDVAEINELVEIVDELVVEKSRKDKLEEMNAALRTRIDTLSHRVLELIGGRDAMQTEYAGAINLAKQAIASAKNNYEDESENAFAKFVGQHDGLKHLVQIRPTADENMRKFIDHALAETKRKIMNGGTAVIRNILAEIGEWTLKLGKFEAEYEQVTAEIRKLTSEIGSNNAEIAEFLKKYPMYAPRQASKQFIPTQKDTRKDKQHQKHQQPRRVLYGLEGLDSARQVILGNQ